MKRVKLTNGFFCTEALWRTYLFILFCLNNALLVHWGAVAEIRRGDLAAVVVQGNKISMRTVKVRGWYVNLWIIHDTPFSLHWWVAEETKGEGTTPIFGKEG